MSTPTDTTTDTTTDAPTDTTTGGARARRRRTVLGGVAVVAVVGLGATGWWAWRTDHDFCRRAAAVPDVATSIDRTGSPAAGLEEAATRLDALADVAPDEATAEAARTLADAQRSTAAALGSDPLAGSAPGAVAEVARRDLDGARARLAEAIGSACEPD